MYVPNVSHTFLHSIKCSTVEPLNNGHGGDEHFVHCSEVVPFLLYMRGIDTTKNSYILCGVEYTYVHQCLSQSMY